MFLHNLFINKDTPIYFVSCKILLECKTDAFHCLYIDTVPVHYTCSVANQVQARKMHHSCVMYVHWQSCAYQNCVRQCMCTPFFEVLHAVNVQTHVCKV